MKGLRLNSMKNSSTKAGINPSGFYEVKENNMIFVLVQTVRIGSSILGIIIPSLIFIIAFVVTWLLFRHFSKVL